MTDQETIRETLEYFTDIQTIPYPSACVMRSNALAALDRMVTRIAELERQLREQCGEYYDPDFAARLRAESDAQESDDRARREQL